MRKEKEVCVRLLPGLIPLLLTLPAVAQTADTAPVEVAQAGKAQALDEIVVTAQRREEKLQDVPVAVTALPESQLQARGIQNVGDLNAVAPGLQISKTPSNTTISQITIRGISQINPAIYWDPAVGIYLDGVYIGKAQGSIFNLVDLTRIEVLRGPQGTLYGRNTLAGAINLVTRAPTGEFGGSASLEIGNYNAFVQRASVDLPKWGIASISVGARSERRDGWVDTTRESSVRELNNRRNDGFRIAADFDFAEGLRGAYRFDRSTVDQTNNFDQLYRLEQTGLFDPEFGPLADLYGPIASFASRERLERASVDAPSFERSEVDGHSFTLTWDVAEHTQIKSITGYRRLAWDDSLDLDGGPLDVVFTQRFTDYDQFSQDLQILGSGDRWNYVAGLYYFGDDGETDNPQSFFFGGAQFDSRYATKSSAWAAYGQLDFRPIDPLTLTAGVRYTREKKELDRVFGVLNPENGQFSYLIPEGTHAEDTFDDTTPVAAIAWRFNDQLNVYFRYAEGFKSGGFNGEFSQAPTGAPDEDIEALIALNLAETRRPFKPERQRSYEIGAKTFFLDNRAQFNVAAFHNELKDFQASIFQGTGAAATIVRNVGSATIRGVELELAMILFEGTQLRANYAWLDPEYDDFRDAQGNNVADNRAFVHAPEHSFNVVLDSELLRRDWGVLRAIADYAWTDDFYTYPYQLTPAAPFEQLAADSRVEAHGLLNLRLALMDVPLGSGATGELSLWCRNALDDDSASNFIDFGPGFGSLTVANFEEPRTFGIAGVVRW